MTYTREGHRAYRQRIKVEKPEVYERELAQARARKDGYRGTCKNCGASTDGSQGPGKAPVYCAHCSPRFQSGPTMQGTGPEQARLFKLLEGGPRRFTEIREILGWTTGMTASTLHRLLSYGLVERPRRGVYQMAETKGGE